MAGRAGGGLLGSSGLCSQEAGSLAAAAKGSPPRPPGRRAAAGRCGLWAALDGPLVAGALGCRGGVPCRLWEPEQAWLLVLQES